MLNWRRIIHEVTKSSPTRSIQVYCDASVQRGSVNYGISTVLVDDSDAIKGSKLVNTVRYLLGS